MNVTKITIGRLFNLGSYEHVRYDITVEVKEGESAATAIIGLEKIIEALNPKMPCGVPSKEETERQAFRNKREAELSDEDWDSQHHFDKVTRTEYLARADKDLAEGIAKREAWLKRAIQARKFLEDVGGAANWKDAKLDWEHDNDYDQ